jgi:membrane-bound metal-dependent hydrolase YbcI (DUF457 family)
MDPITHALAGGLVARSTSPSWKRFWIFCFLGEAPDLDVFLGHLGPWAFILQHRGLTHSVFGVLGQAIFYVLLFSRLDREDSFSKKCGLYCLPLFLHIFFDYLTSYGVPLFSPFTLRNFQADIVTSVNIIPVLFMGFGFLQHTRPQRLWMIWIFYIALSFSGRIYAKKLVPGGGDVTTVPTLYNPLLYNGVKTDVGQRYYYCYEVNVLTRHVKEKYIVPMPPDNFIITASLGSNDVKSFFIENRWPVVRLTKTAVGWDVDWGSILFSTRGLVRGKVRVSVSEDGRILDSYRMFIFWSV